MDNEVITNGNKESITKNPITRKDFLKTAALVAGALALGPSLTSCINGDPKINKSENSKTEIIDKELFHPEIISGSEVYGLKEPITSENQIYELYEHFDRKFAENHWIQVVKNNNKIEQKANILNPNERYLEIVVRKSAYESFINKKEETTVDFPEWIQMHVDLMNRCFDSTKPPIKMKAVLQRVVVVEDDMPNTFWNRENNGKPNCALDLRWIAKFSGNLPMDVDTSFAVPFDYRDGYNPYGLMNYVDDGGNLILESFPIEQNRKKFVFPYKNDLLQKKPLVFMDFALIHEWSHFLLNLPDQYEFDVNQLNPSRFKEFHVVTGRSFHEPELSPYLAMFLNNNIKKRARSHVFQNEMNNITEHPNNVAINTSLSGINPDNLKIYKANIETNYMGVKSFSDKPDLEVNEGMFSFTENLFDDGVLHGANVWLIKANFKGIEKHLFVPAAAFQMSKFAGLESVNYKIEFSDTDNMDKNIQILEIVNESDMVQNFTEHTNEGHIPYAIMKVEGTDNFFIWYIKN